MLQEDTNFVASKDGQDISGKQSKALYGFRMDVDNREVMERVVTVVLGI